MIKKIKQLKNKLINKFILHELKNKFGEFKYKLNDNNEVVAINLSNRGVETKDLELIGRLTSLEKLDFSENKITKIQGLDNLTSLKNLHLENNQITEIQGLNNLVELEYLNLNDNQISKIQGLEKSTKLRWLNLGHNQITKIEGLDNLTNLKDIDFFDTNIPKKEIEQFKINNPEIFVFYNSELAMALLDLIKQNK